MAAQTDSSRQLHIEAIQTVTPAKASEPGWTRKISAKSPLTGEFLRAHHQIVAYYKASTVNCHTLVGWFKESLNAALGDNPLFAGRLMWNEEEANVEIKFSDAGLRLVQAKAEMSMEEFMAMEGKKGKEDLLVYWKDIDETRPQVCALCYVQVTGFAGDGFSVGLSCSVLLADQVMLTGFFKSWARLHTSMVEKENLSKMPIFHLAKFQRSGRSSHLCSTPLDDVDIPPTTTSYTLTLQLPAGSVDLGGREAADTAARCLAEVMTKYPIEERPAPEFLLIGGGKELVTAEKYPWKKEGLGGIEFEVVNWGILKAAQAAIGEGNMPILVSHHVKSKEAVVVIMLSSGHDDGLGGLITATIPKKI